jgi:hypothetical protein
MTYSVKDYLGSRQVINRYNIILRRIIRYLNKQNHHGKTEESQEIYLGCISSLEDNHH